MKIRRTKKTIEKAKRMAERARRDFPSAPSDHLFQRMDVALKLGNERGADLIELALDYL